MAKNSTLGAEAMLHTIHLKRKEVIALLLQHGVVVKSGASDLEIAMQVTDLCKTSKSFYNAFMLLLSDKSVLTNVWSNMDGNYLGITDALNDWCNKGDNAKLLPTSCKDAKPTSTSGTKDTTSNTKDKSESWFTTALNLAQTGFNGYLQLDDNKTKRALADASVRVAESGGLNTNDNLPPPTSHTTLYVVLGLLGVSLVGLVVYFATKKKV